MMFVTKYLNTLKMYDEVQIWYCATFYRSFNYKNLMYKMMKRFQFRTISNNSYSQFQLLEFWEKWRRYHDDIEINHFEIHWTTSKIIFNFKDKFLLPIIDYRALYITFNKFYSKRKSTYFVNSTVSFNFLFNRIS